MKDKLEQDSGITDVFSIQNFLCWVFLFTGMRMSRTEKGCTIGRMMVRFFLLDRNVCVCVWGGGQQRQNNNSLLYTTLTSLSGQWHLSVSNYDQLIAT